MDELPRKSTRRLDPTGPAAAKKAIERLTHNSENRSSPRVAKKYAEWGAEAQRDQFEMQELNAVNQTGKDAGELGMPWNKRFKVDE